MYNLLHRTRSEMDITTVFGTVIVGSNPTGCAEMMWITMLVTFIKDMVLHCLLTLNQTKYAVK